MKNKFRKCSFIAIMLCATIFGICNCQNAHAQLVATDSQLYEVSLLNGLQQCYQAGIKDSIQVSDFSGFNSILSKPNNKVYITTHIGNSLNGNSDNDLKCSEVVSGYRADKTSNSAKGVKQIIKDAATPADAGYKFEQSASDSSTKKITMNDFQGNTTRNKVTFEGSIEVSNADSGKASCAGTINAVYNNKTIAWVTCSSGDVISAGGPVQAPYDMIYPYMRSNDEIKDEIINDFTTFVYNYSTGPDFPDDYPFIGDTNELSGSMTTVSSSNGNSQMANYVPISNGASISGIALKNIGVSNSVPGCYAGSLYTNGQSYDTINCSFSTAMTYALYYRYVQNNDGLQIQECGPTKASGAAYYVKNSADTWCTIAVTNANALSDSYSVVERGRLKSGNMQTVLNWLSDESSYQYLKDGEYADAAIDNSGTVIPSTDPNAGGITGSEKTCYDGAGALGWVLCPILEGLADTTSDIYTNVVEPSLRTEPGLLTDNGVADVWGIFRNLANIAFAILLLVIIFSQVTGIGIDNYGIKKVLPKLIIAAVLINLSYIICQLAVDLSNILGSSLKSMLDNFSGSVSTTISYGGEPTDKGTVSGGATVLSVFLPLIVATGAILAQGWAILLPLIMVAISAVVAVIFVFLLLSVRKAGVVILVAISPLAFVCYMLPNTKKLFDKWLKMFEGLLLLYPICGLLIGGGNFASKILLRTNMGNDNFFFALSAMLINIAPFFFIPTVLKGSFAAMGNLGAKISGFGKSLSGRANKAVGGSEWYKNAGLRAKGGIDSNGNVTRFGKLRQNIASKTGFGRSGMARARAGAIKANGDIKKNNMLLSDNYAEAARAAQDSAMNKEALENEMARIKAGGPIDNDRYNSELGKLLAKDSLTKDEEMQAKAYMKLLANGGGYGKKLLASTMAGASTGTRGFAAQFMSKDADVAGAVATKNAAAAQYLREVNAGGMQQYFDANGNIKTTAQAGSFEDWKNLKRKDTGISNAQFVANNITDKDEDFIAQSDGAIKAAIADKAVTDDRLRAIYDNDLLYNSATEEVRKVISTHLGRPYNRADYTPESGNNFPTELTIEHSDGRTDTIRFGSGSPTQQNNQNPGTGTPNQA